MACLAVLPILGLLGGPLCAQPQPAVTIEPKAGDNFSKASFSLRVPEKVKNPRYILVLVPGLNQDGAHLLDQRPWRDFAEETDGAMVACSFSSEPTPGPHGVRYSAARHGSGAALESAIGQLDAMDSAHSLKDLPLLIYGFSAGGQFAYGFSCHHPQRMIGFAALKGGYYSPEPIDGTYGVPGLVVSGNKDLARRRKAIRALFESHRTRHAPWCWMEDAGEHEEGACVPFVVSYFRELLKLRLRKDGTVPRDIAADDGVTIDLAEQRILGNGSAIPSREDIARTGFLPSNDVFKAWKLLDNGRLKYAEPGNEGGKQ